MKLKQDGRVWLQRYDITFLAYELDSTPRSVISEIFSEQTFFIADANDERYQFEAFLEQPENVTWVMSQEWLVNYTNYADVPLEELEALLRRIRDRHSSEVEDFNSMSQDYRKQHYRDACEQFSKDSHRIASFEALIQAKKGEAKFLFPGETPPVIHTDPSTKRSNPITRLFQQLANLFDRGAQ